MFCGKKWRLAYELGFYASTLVTLWSYVVLFGASLSVLIGIPGVSDACDIEKVTHNDLSNNACRNLYSVWCVVFWGWSLIITMVDFSEQAYFQIFLCLIRFLAILLMTITSIGLIYSKFVYNGKFEWNPELQTPNYSKNIRVFEWIVLMYFVSISTMAFNAQMCLPDVVTPLRNEQRTALQIDRMFAYGTFWAFVLYTMCGLSVSLYFGEKTESPCTLAWAHFKGFSKSNQFDPKPIWVLIVDWLIVLFPAIDVTSAFPVQCITFANTLESTFLTRVQRNDPRFTVAFRVTLCTISAVLALTIWNFTVVAAIAGVLSLIVFGVVCPFLEYCSVNTCQIIVSGPPTVFRSHTYESEMGIRVPTIPPLLSPTLLRQRIIPTAKQNKSDSTSAAIVVTADGTQEYNHKFAFGDHWSSNKWLLIATAVYSVIGTIGTVVDLAFRVEY